ncbi:MAG: recombination mediator RecR [Brevinema sp.]
MLPESITRLSKMLARLPGVGPKSAERLALWFVSDGAVQASQLGTVLSSLSQFAGVCPQCGFFSEGKDKLCVICSSGKRRTNELCLVEQASDVMDIEESGGYQGLYFVLGGLISPLEGRTVSDLPINKLQERIQHGVGELIIALGATTEADVTSMYLQDVLKQEGLVISGLARGIAAGTRISFAGKKSIAEAFKARERF